MEIKNGLRQLDALTCLLFNIALEKLIRDANINSRGTIFYKSVRTNPYAYDIIIIARTETAAKKMLSNINKEKTKYMLITRKDCSSYPSCREIRSYKFEIVHSFTYLGSESNCKNNISIKIGIRTLSAGRSFPGLRKTLGSQLVPRKT
jgi:sorting nexin-29